MKLTMDEKVKHRIIGLAVIFSIGAIFAPAIIKKSNQRFDGNMNVSVKLPPKPDYPQVSMPNEKAMFKSVKVAQVDITPLRPTPAAPVIKPAVLHPIPAAEPAQVVMAAAKQVNEEKVAQLKPQVNSVARAPEIIAKNQTSQSPVINKVLPKPAAVKVMAKSVASAKPAVAKKTAPTNKRLPMPLKPKISARSGYAVQVAMFSIRDNADLLVTKLKQRGYRASHNKILTKNGVRYKVLVGPTNQRTEAEIMKRRLAQAQISGFIVTTAIS